MTDAEVKVVGYLSALNIPACDKYCELKGSPGYPAVPVTMDDPAVIMDCIATFLQEGVSLSFLFENASVWGVYLKAISESRFHPGIDLLLQMGTPEDLMYYCRATYRFGFPAIPDELFDPVEKLYFMTYPAMSFLMNQTYDDDKYGPLVEDAIRMANPRLGKKEVEVKSSQSSAVMGSEYAELNSDKSTSIRPVVGPVEAFDFWRSSPVCDVHFSLKIDGVNTKTAFDADGGGLKLAISRGRATDSIDYTEAFRRILLCNNVDASKLHGRIVGESFVGLQHLKYIQDKYIDKDYKTPKSTAMAMLRASDKFDPADYKYLSFCPFSYGELRPDEGFTLLAQAGFTPPPAITVKGSEIPRDSLEHFNSWMKCNILDPLWEKGLELGIGSDGVVMYLLTDVVEDRSDKYTNYNIAIKYDHWRAAHYQSIVEDIIFEQQRVEASIVLQVAPVVMRDSNTATRVGVGSPDILIRDGIKIGDTIEFERKSEAYNVYLKKI